MGLHGVPSCYSKSYSRKYPEVLALALSAELCPGYPIEGHYLTLLSCRTSGGTVFKMLPFGHHQDSLIIDTEDKGHFLGNVMQECNVNDVPRVVQLGKTFLLLLGLNLKGAGVCREF